MRRCPIYGNFPNFAANNSNKAEIRMPTGSQIKNMEKDVHRRDAESAKLEK
jgi:hypothetical protein